MNNKADSIANRDPVDLSVLKSMIGNDEAELREVLVGFIAPAHNIIEEIQLAQQECSAERVMIAAHKLKSAAGSIGAKSLAELCSKLERAGRNGDYEFIAMESGRLCILMKEISAYIARY